MRIIKYIFIINVLITGCQFDKDKSNKKNFSITNTNHAFIKENYKDIFLWNKKLQIGNLLPDTIIYNKNITFINKNAYSEKAYDTVEWNYKLLPMIKKVNDRNRKETINSSNNIFSNTDSIYILSNPLFSKCNKYALIHQIRVSIGNNDYKTNTNDDYIIWYNNSSFWSKYPSIKKEVFIERVENEYLGSPAAQSIN